MEVRRVTSQSAALNEPILLRQDRDGISTVTLNRPQARNAISIALMEELSTALATLARDPAVKVVILAAESSSIRAMEIALRAWGRLRVTVAIPSRSWRRRMGSFRAADWDVTRRTSMGTAPASRRS